MVAWIILAIVLALGCVVMLFQLKSANKTIENLRRDIADELAKSSKLKDEIAQFKVEVATLKANKEQNSLLLKQQEERFKNLANEILDNNARRFNESSSQKLNDLLTPLKDNIENFRKAVGEAYNSESRERFSLQKELRELLELNKTIGKEARDLTRALRSDTKMQGDWGEMILEKLLEKSGLQKGIHFDTQVTRDNDQKLVGEDGHSLRADVVIYYPDDRCLVIDSKVSLTSFINYVNLADDPDDVDGSMRKKAADAHLASVKSHIKELATKNYQDLIGKKRMDFVMMFIPNEAAYIAAMQIEPTLWQEAYDKRVLIVSPTQLISVLRMLRQLWKQDAVNKNVEEIARLSGSLLDKFSGMMDAFDDMERHISNTQKAYTTLRSRLSEGKGNIFVTAQKIRDLGAKSTKQLPEK
jgi:DNA recombination protein RmuC